MSRNAPSDLVQTRENGGKIICYFGRMFGVLISEETEEMISVYHMQIWYTEIVADGFEMDYLGRYWRSQLILKSLPYDFLVFSKFYGDSLERTMKAIGKRNIKQYERGDKLRRELEDRLDDSFLRVHH